MPLAIVSQIKAKALRQELLTPVAAVFEMTAWICQFHIVQATIRRQRQV